MSVTVNPKARQILPVILGCCVIGTVFFPGNNYLFRHKTIMITYL